MFLADDLAAYMATIDGDLMFPNERGGWIRNTLWRRRVFDVTTERLGLTPPTLRVHDLRHTAASFMIRSGADVKRVQKQLGHRSAVLTLDTYSHLWPDSEGRTRTAVDTVLGAPADSLQAEAAE